MVTKTRDFLCVILFGFCVLAFACISAYAFTYGEPQKLIPANLGKYQDDFYALDDQEIQILKHDFGWLVFSLSLAILVSIGWLSIVRNLSAFMVYIFALLSIVSVSLMGTYLHSLSLKYQSFELSLLAYTCWAGSVILTFFLFAFREKILFTSNLLKESGKILRDNPALLSLSAILSCFYLIMLLITVSVVVYLCSVPITNEDSDNFSPVTSAGGILALYDSQSRNLSWLVILFAIWFGQVFVVFQSYVVASTTVFYVDYLAGKQSQRTGLILRSIKLAMLRKFGTIVFAALVKSIFVVFGAFARYVNRKNTSTSRVLPSFIFKLLKAVINSVVDFSVAFSSFNNTGFWGSAKAVTKLLKRELATTAFSKLVIYYILATGQILGSILVSAITVAIIDWRHAHVNVVTVLVIFVSTYTIFNIITETYISVTNTVFLLVLYEMDSGERKLPPEIYSTLQLGEPGA